MADVIRNTYGWNVMKPDVIDDELWNDIYDTYVRDKNGLGMEKYFSETNPAALQEMTAVMLETIRKGMWDASDEQTKTLADLHARMVEKHGAACSGFVCDNSRLRDFIKSNIPTELKIVSGTGSERRFGPFVTICEGHRSGRRTYKTATTVRS